MSSRIVLINESDFGKLPIAIKGISRNSECKIELEASLDVIALIFIWLFSSKAGIHSGSGAWECIVGSERNESIERLVWHCAKKYWNYRNE